MSSSSSLAQMMLVQRVVHFRQGNYVIRNLRVSNKEHFPSRRRAVRKDMGETTGAAPAITFPVMADIFNKLM